MPRSVLCFSRIKKQGDWAERRLRLRTGLDHSFSECVLENTNFLGGGLSKADGGQGIPTGGHEECSLECQQRSKCTHWEDGGTSAAPVLHEISRI